MPTDPPSSSTNESKRLALLGIAGVFGLFAWFFGSVLCSNDTFAFRDASHFYHPLLEWIHSEWRSGRIPLWNPQENGGTPVMADNTASVFYPGSLCFFLPLAYVTCLKLYVTGHVLLAAATAFALSRRWGASNLAASCCAVSYAFSGKTLFEHTNVVILVGAAWLPAALWTADRMLKNRDWRSAVACGFVFSMMILGGEPQSVYHSLLLIVGYAWFLRKEEPSQTPSLASNSFRTKRAALIAVSLCCAAAISAIQILPTREWAADSDRTVYDKPRNIYEAAAVLIASDDSLREATSNSTDASALHADPPSRWQLVREGLFGRAKLTEPLGQSLQFSVGPWRLPELFWPNVFGRWFPGNQRWIPIVLAETDVWTPSLYLGLWPLLLALRSWNVRRGPAWARLMAWTLLLAVLAAFGEWGLGAIPEFIEYCQTKQYVQNPLIGRQVGGLYWAMVTFLPMYANFRYPAKLWGLATLAISLLAARGWDRVFTRNEPIDIRSWLGFVGRQSVVGAIVALILLPFWHRYMRYVPLHLWFGNIDAAGAWRDFLFAFLQTALLCGLLWLLVSRYRKTSQPAWAAAAFALTCFDVAIANGWLVQPVDESIVRNESSVVAAMRENDSQRDATTSDASPFHSHELLANDYRVYRGVPWWPDAWWQQNSRTRLADTFAWHHESLYPKFHLRQGVSLIEAQGTMFSSDWQQLLFVARKFGVPRNDGVMEPHPSVLEALSTRYVLTTKDVTVPNAKPLQSSAGRKAADATDAVLWELNSPLPRTWVVHDVQVMSPLEHKTLSSLRQRTAEVFFPNNTPRDLRSTAIVETNNTESIRQLIHSSSALNVDQTVPSKVESVSGSIDQRDLCRTVLREPQRIDLEVTLERPGLLVCNDFFFSGWVATIQSQGKAEPWRAEILRTNRVMRGVALPAGSHRVTFEYKPNSFRIGMAISLTTWLVLPLILAFDYCKRRLQRHHPPLSLQISNHPAQ